MVLGFPLTALGASQEYYTGNTAKNVWHFSGYRVWTVSGGYGTEFAAILLMEAKAGAKVSQGMTSVFLTIPPSEQVNRYISCRWVADSNWNEPDWIITCSGVY